MQGEESTTPADTRQLATSDSGRLKRLGLLALVGLLVVSGAFIAGNIIGDDSDQVSDLKAEVAELAEDLDDSESDLAYIEDELELSDEQKSNLASQLKAEESLSGEVEEIVEGSNAAPDADYLAGVAGTVGEFVMRPTVELNSNSGEEATWHATIEVKNNGSSPAELFCGGSEVTLVDMAGRSYEGEGVLADNTANCGSSLQPGLTIDNYVIEFNLPANAEPALIEVAAGPYGEGPIKSWGVEVE